MSTPARYCIKFKHGDLAYLRTRLLADLSREHFAVLLGKTQQINGYTIITVIDLLFPVPSDYAQQSVASLRIRKDFIHRALSELTGRYDVDTMIDVHTHPFTSTGVSFSATDDEDERAFFCFLNDTFEGLALCQYCLLAKQVCCSRLDPQQWLCGREKDVIENANPSREDQER